MIRLLKVSVRLLVLFSIVAASLLMSGTVGLAQSGGIIATDPLSIDFGNVFEDIQSVSAQIDILNTGTANLKVTDLMITGSDADEFALVVTQWPFTLKAGNKEEVAVVFEPTSPGVKNAVLHIVSNAENTNTYDVPLTGKGLALSAAGSVKAEAVVSNASPLPGEQINVAIYIDLQNATAPADILDTYQATLQWDPTKLQYRSYSAGDTPWRRPSSVDRSKVNKGSLEFYDYYYNGASGRFKVVEFRFKVIGNAGSSAPLDLEFSRLIGPEIKDLLPILSTADAAVQIGGSATPPDIAVSPTSYNYGDVGPGNSATQTFVVKNEGIEALHVSNVSLTGSRRDQFSIVIGGEAFALASGENHEIQVAFAPTSSGQKTASLVITSDDPDEGEYTVALSGAARAPDIRVDPTALDFGNVKPGASLRKNITVYNDGTGTLIINLYSVEGDANDFSFNAGIWSVIGAGKHKTIRLYFRPTTTGTKNANFVLHSNDPDEVAVAVSLTGNGSTSANAKSASESEVIAADQNDDQTEEEIHTVYLPAIQGADE